MLNFYGHRNRSCPDDFIESHDGILNAMARECNRQCHSFISNADINSTSENYGHFYHQHCRASTVVAYCFPKKDIMLPRPLEPAELLTLCCTGLSFCAGFGSSSENDSQKGSSFVTGIGSVRRLQGKAYGLHTQIAFRILHSPFPCNLPLASPTSIGYCC